MKNRIFDVIIIGAGPAGLSAAIYGKRANLDVLVIEKSVPGGKLLEITNISNYPGYNQKDGANLAYIMYEQVNELKTDFVFEEVINVIDHQDYKEIITEMNTYQTKNIIVATGMSYQHLHVANEKKFTGKGISFCAVCDGKLFTGKDIAVIGSNDKALKECLYLAEFAQKIYLLADKKVENKNVLANPKIEIIDNGKLTKLIGNDYLEAIEINNQRIINVEGVFPLLNEMPSNGFLSDFDIFNSFGYMIVDNKYQSKVPGIYGIGDIIEKDLRQVVTACNDGALAIQYIKSKK